MFITGHIYYPTNSGSPSHNLCGQASSIVSFTNLKFNLSLTKNGITNNLVNTNDLSTLGSLTPTTYTFGNIDIVFNGMIYSSVHGYFKIDLKIYKTGTTQTITSDSVLINLSINAPNYSLFNNTFEFYNYDVGNDTTLGITGNTAFDIYLIPLSDYNSNHQQQNAFSNFCFLFKPFTTETYIYNLVGTQGTIQYINPADSTIIGYGNFCKFCTTNYTVVGGIISINQIVNLPTGDTCTKNRTRVVTTTDNNIQWLPIFIVTSSCNVSCGDGCVVGNNTNIKIILDYSNTIFANVDGVLSFLTQYLFDNIILKQYDSTGILVDIQSSPYSITYLNWLANPSLYLNPLILTTTLMGIGDNVIRIDNIMSLTNDSGSGIDNGDVISDIIIDCFQTITIPTCDIFTISKSGTCGTYNYRNNTLNNQYISLSILGDNGFNVVFTSTLVNPLTTIPIILSNDGIYLIGYTPSLQEDEDIFYTIASFCKLETCFNDYLQKVICCPPSNDCESKEYYEFFAFMINLHSFFMTLNDEFNFNYLYTALGDVTNKLDTFYTMKSFIDRFNEYCITCNKPCLPCEESKRKDRN